MDGGELCSARCAEQPFDVGFHPNSQIFVAGLITGEVEVWERDAARDAARKLKTVRCHDAACRTLAFVNDGALLLTGSSDRSILATDVATSKPLARLTNAHKAAVNRIISIDANTVASGDDDGVVKVWDTRKQTACGQFAPFVDFVSDITHVPMGAGSGEQTPGPAAVDPASPGTSAAGAAAGAAAAAAAHPGTLVAASGDGTVGHLCLRSFKTLGQSYTLDDELLSVCVMKRGKKTLAGSQTGVLNVFDYGKWEDPSDRFPGHPSSIDALVKVDEDTVLTGSSDGIIRVIGVLPNKMLGVVGEHGDMPVERMALSPDRTALATASHDHTIKLWDVKYLFEEGGAGLRASGDGDDDEGDASLRAELGGAAVDGGDDSDDSDSEGGGGKRKRKKKEKKSKMAGSGEARAAAKKQAAKKFFDGL